MKAVAALLFALVPLIWIYLKHYTKKANGFVQANLALERLDAQLVAGNWREAKVVFDSLILKTLQYPEVNAYFERLPMTERNKRCMLYMKLLSILDELESIPSDVLLSCQDKFDVTGLEMDSHFDKLWKMFDRLALHEDRIAAQINIVLSIAQSILHFAKNGETQQAQRALMRAGGEDFPQETIHLREDAASVIEYFLFNLSSIKLLTKDFTPQPIATQN